MKKAPKIKKKVKGYADGGTIDPTTLSPQDKATYDSLGSDTDKQSFLGTLAKTGQYGSGAGAGSSPGSSLSGGNIAPWLATAESMSTTTRKAIPKDQNGIPQGSVNKTANEWLTPNHENAMNHFSEGKAPLALGDLLGTGELFRGISKGLGKDTKTSGFWGDVNKQTGITDDYKTAMKNSPNYNVGATPVQHMAGGGTVSSAKAKEILRDGTAQGKKLTPAQKRYFGWIAGGSKAEGGDVHELRPMYEDGLANEDHLRDLDANSGGQGGAIAGKGTAKSDSIKAKVEPGSFIVPVENSHAAKLIRSMYLKDDPNKQADVHQADGSRVNLSDGEQMFTPQEKAYLLTKGVDLKKLAPNAKNESGKADGGPVPATAPVKHNITVPTYYQRIYKDPKTGKVALNYYKYDIPSQSTASYLQMNRNVDSLPYAKQVPVDQKEFMNVVKTSPHQVVYGKVSGEMPTNENKLFYTPEEFDGSNVEGKAEGGEVGDDDIVKQAKELLNKEQKQKNDVKKLSEDYDKRQVSDKNAAEIKRESDKKKSDIKMTHDRLSSIIDDIKKENVYTSDKNKQTNRENLKNALEQYGNATKANSESSDIAATEKSNGKNKPYVAYNPANPDTTKSATTKGNTPQFSGVKPILSRKPVKVDGDLGLTPREIKPIETNPAFPYQDEVVPSQKTDGAKLAGSSTPSRTVADDKNTGDGIPASSATSKTKSGSSFIPEEGLGIAQALIGGAALVNDGKRPVDTIPADYMNAVTQAVAESKYGLDPASKEAYDTGVEGARSELIGQAAQTAGADPTRALAGARMATNDYAKNMLDVIAADNRAKLVKEQYANQMLTNKSEMQRRLFDDKINAFNVNQQAGAELLGTGLQNTVGAMRYSREKDFYKNLQDKQAAESATFGSQLANT